MIWIIAAGSRTMPDRFSISDVAPACWRLGRRFDLVFLTGHAFQVFLTDDDQRAVLSTIAEHLAPSGRFIFDTRSPAAQAWREWTPMPSMRRFDHPSLGPVEAWNDIGHDATTGIVTYQTHYRVVSSDQQFSAASKIQFTNQERLAALLEGARLEVDEWLGECLPTDIAGDYSGRRAAVAPFVAVPGTNLALK